MNNKVVYIHRKETNGEIFYVGIGNLDRAYFSHQRSTIWNRTVKKYGKVVEVIKAGISWEEACDIEIALISYYGRKNTRTGILVNLTDGGEGNTNMFHSKESRAKRSAKMKGRSMPKNAGENSHFSKKVIDISNNKTYCSLREAAKDFPMSYVTLAAQLNGRLRRKELNTFYYIDDNNNVIKDKDSWLFPYKSVFVNGVEYSTVKVAASMTEYTIHQINHRIRSNVDGFYFKKVLKPNKYKG